MNNFKSAVRNSSLLQNLQTASGIHPASYSNRYWGAFTLGEYDRGMNLTSHFVLLLSFNL